MIDIAMYTTILTLYKQGKTRRDIHRITGIARNTVNRLVKEFYNKLINIIA